MTSLIPWKAFWNTSASIIALPKSATNLPIVEAALRIPSAKPLITPPISEPNTSIKDFIASLANLIGVNKPSNASLSLRCISSVTFKDLVKSKKPRVMLARRSPDIAGNISRNASRKGLNTSATASPIFLIAPIKFSRPPFSRHSRSMSFRRSATLAIALPTVLSIPVHNFLASSKSPNINSKVSPQPEAIDSFQVSNN